MARYRRPARLLRGTSKTEMKSAGSRQSARGKNMGLEREPARFSASNNCKETHAIAELKSADFPNMPTGPAAETSVRVDPLDRTWGNLPTCLRYERHETLLPRIFR